MEEGSRQPEREAPPPQVFFALDGVEHAAPVPIGADRWERVARALAEQLRCPVRAEEPPVYDSGTRIWTLAVTLQRSWGRRRTLSVPVRW